MSRYKDPVSMCAIFLEWVTDTQAIHMEVWLSGSEGYFSRHVALLIGAEKEREGPVLESWAIVRSAGYLRWNRAVCTT